jgi:hypothetical protein
MSMMLESVDQFINIYYRLSQQINCNDPIVTTTSEAVFFLFSFFFSGVKRQEGDNDNSLITPLTMNASTQSRKKVTMTPHTGSRQLVNMRKITRRTTTLPTQTRPRLQAKGQHPHPDIMA